MEKKKTGCENCLPNFLPEGLRRKAGGMGDVFNMGLGGCYKCS